jgi:hypothetical protein
MDTNNFNPDLNIDLNLSGISSEQQLNVDQPLPDGKYHVALRTIEPNRSGDKPFLTLAFEVLHGPYEGRPVTERLYLTENNRKRIHFFALRLGLIGRADLGNTSVRRNWGEAVGKQCVIEVATREYTKKDGSKGKTPSVTYGGIWKLDDPAVADVPKHSNGQPAKDGQRPAFPDI